MNRFRTIGLIATAVTTLLVFGCARREVRPGRKEPGRETLPSPEVPLDYSEILRTDALTREDVAALLADGLGDAAALRMKPRFYDSGKGITDIESSRRRTYVENAVKLGLMDVFPDGSFQPQDVVQRAHFAIIVQNILNAFQQSSLPRLATSPYRDVPATHYAYNAILLAARKAILKPRSPGLFAPFEPINGQEAVEAIERLKALLK